MTTSKPRILIFSTTEGLTVAEDLQSELEYVAETTLWTQDLFKISGIVIDDLDFAVRNTDFAAFVFSPDDITTLRNQELITVRDNIIGEYFFALAILTRKRVFAVAPRPLPSNFHLPTDLAGITHSSYDTTRADGNFRAALGPFARQIKRQIADELKNEHSNLLGYYTTYSGKLSFSITATKETVDAASFLITYDLPDRNKENMILTAQEINSHPCSFELKENFTDPITRKVGYGWYAKFIEPIKVGFPRRLSIIVPDQKEPTFINLYHEYEEGKFSQIKATKTYPS